MSNEENQVKVYELAKELGTDSFTLLEKLKELSIEVKSHMSGLSAEDVTKAKEAFAPAKSSAAKTTKTRTAKTTKAAATTTTTAATKTTKSTTKTATKVAAKSTAAQSAEVKKSSSTVIRRRSNDTGALETIKDNSKISTTEQTQSEQNQDEFENSQESQQQISSAEFSETEQTPQENQMTSQVTPNEPVTQFATHSSFTQHSLLGARQGGQTAKNTGSILTIIKHEPKKFVKPVPAANNSTAPKKAFTTPTPAGIINLGKDAIEKLIEEDSFNKKKRGERDRDLNVVKDFKIQDYRAKKELVFLPKRKKIQTNRDVKKTMITKPAAHKMVVRFENSITVSELAQAIGQKVGLVIKKLISMGTMATINQALDFDTTTIIASEYGYTVENVAFKEASVISKDEDSADSLQPRPPIVTVMGHVDHGKTSLLDSIRKANVASGEAGGITQHIGAYTVEIDGKRITFIDTPGHEAFTLMRSRGANSTDIVILVVAADDGVMPQTREALDHARAAGVPIIVAINKIDKPGANPDRILKELADLDLLAEEWGGQSMFMRVSATQKTGIKELLEAILLQADVLDLKANPDRLAEGVVLEASIDKNRGVVADILVKRGTLKIGDHLVCGQHTGRVRAMMNSKGLMVKSVGPSEAVELLGLEGVPSAGEPFNAVATDADATKLIDFRKEKSQKEALDARSNKISLEDMFAKAKQGNIKELPVILKTDVYGSAEAIKDSLLKIPTDQVKIKVISSASGGITESDVLLASASKAIILGFNVRPETKALQLAESKGIEIKNYTIIYELIDDVKKAMAGLLDKKVSEKYLGRAEVRNTFNVPKAGTVAGCFVVDGKILRGAQARLLRDSRIIFTGKLSSLKRFKDDAKEVTQGYECGTGLENYNDIKVGDIIEAFEIEMLTQELDTTIAKATGKTANQKSESNEART